MDQEPHPAPITNQQPLAKKSSSPRKYFLYIVIAGLVISALISVVAVLVGEFNEFVAKSLATTFLCVGHALLFLLLTTKPAAKQKTSDAIIVNTMLGIAVISFIVSILGTWQLVDGMTVYRVYVVLFYTFTLCVLAKALLSVDTTDTVVRPLAYTSLGFGSALYLLLIPTVFLDSTFNLPELYYRLLSAVAILLGTCSVLTAVFQKLRK